MSKAAQEGFDSAPVYERLPDFDVGTYVAELVEAGRFDSANGEGEYFKARWRVLEAAPGSKTAPGDEVCTLIGLFGQFKKSQFGRVKNIIGAITHEASSKITYDDFLEATAPENELGGAKVKVYATAATSKKGNDYAQSTFVPYRPIVAVATPAT